MFRNSSDISPSCSSAEELVSYLYNEMDPVGRPAFEGHLADCDLCTAEMAEISFARLDVYEWHRDEFLEMPTPRIEIPYAAVTQASWLETIKAFFASPVRLATAGGAFAVVAMASIWLAAPGFQDIAHIDPVPPPVSAESRSSSAAGVPVPELSKNDPADLTAVSNGLPGPAGRTSAVKASVRRDSKPVPVRPKSSRQRTPARTELPVLSAPRLDDFEDFDDDTLRLGDLIAEAETRD